MKEQYVGDIGDFGKMLLLKHLASLGFKIGINWVLTKDDDGTDGKHRDYPWFGVRHKVNNPLYPKRSKPDDGRDCLACSTDEGMLKEIAQCAVKPRGCRKIQDLERVLTEVLPDKPAFFREVYQDGDDRKSKNISALAEFGGTDLTFFDPDNGLSFQEPQRGKSPKHIYLDELLTYWAECKSLLLYHHWGRPKGGNLPIIEGIQSRLENELKGSTLFTCTFRRGSTRTYFLAVHPAHSGRTPDGELEGVKAMKPLTLAMDEWRRIAKPCQTTHLWQFNPAAPPLPPSPLAPCQR